MSDFNLGSLNDWVPVALGDLVDFDTGGEQFRACRFDVLASHPVRVMAVTADDVVNLLAVGDGLFSVSFSTPESVGVTFASDHDALVYFRTRVETQMIRESEGASFTVIEPRQNAMSDEMRRMVQMMRYNQERMRQDLQADFDRQTAALRGELGASRVSPAPAPAAAPVAAPAPSGDGVVE